MSFLRTRKALGRRARGAAAFIVAGALVATMTAASNQSLSRQEAVESKDGTVSAAVNTRVDGTIDLTVARDGRTVLKSVELGMLTEAADLTTGLTFERSERIRHNQTYLPGGAVNGPVSSIVDEMIVHFRKGTAKLAVAVRVSPDGAAFRYTVTVPGTSAVVRETTVYDPVDGSTVWASPYERHYEGKPQRFDTRESLGGKHLGMPALISTVDGRWVQLTEAAARTGTGYPAIRLYVPGGNSGKLRSALPGPDSAVFDTSLAGTRVPFDGTITTPWRVIGIAASIEGLARSSLLTDLNRAPSTELSGAAAGWIKPGVSLWPWWSDSLGGDHYLPLHREYVDAAERLGVPYVTADAGYASWDALEELAGYAASRGVGVFAWTHRNHFSRSDGALFDQAEIDAEMKSIAARGIVGLKIDFFDSDRADIMRLYDRLSIGAGRAKLMVNFHGSTKPGGEQRTYPHVLTSEGVAGAEGYKNGNPSSARDNVNMTLTRGLLGSADATPVALSLTDPLSTQAHQLALTVAFTSALTTLADTPAAYESWPGLDVLRSLPTVWNQSRVIDAKPDSHAAFARRSGDVWYVGAITDGERQLPVPLDFLGAGSYTATVYRDGGAGGQPLVERSTVTSRDRLILPLAEHGGATVVLTPGDAPRSVMADRVLESESADLAGNARVSACPSCSGGAEVGYLGREGVAFRGLEAEGVYTARITYLSGEKRRLAVTVDGVEVTTVTPPESGKGNGTPNGWQVPRTVDVPLDLEPGKHTVVLSAPDGYGPDLDRVALIRRYEAEDPSNILTGRAVRRACADEACSGGQVGDLGLGASVTFTAVNAQKSGTTTVGIRYASAVSRVILVRVNGGPERRVIFSRTAAWDDWSLRTITLDLQAGENTVTLAAESGSWAPDIDAIEVAQ